MTRFAAPIAEQIWDMKYRLKDADGVAIDQTVEDTWRRIARAIAAVENDPSDWEDTFYAALQDFKFLPAGRITAGAGTDRSVTLFNCFVMGTVPDSMSGIFEHLREAALTMQQGGGSVMISRQSAQRARPCLASPRMPAGRSASWMCGMPCAAPSYRLARGVVR